MLPADTFKSQVAVVTGGGTGIGQAIARNLATLGARVVLASRNLSNLEPARDAIVAAGGEAYAIAADVRDPEQVRRLFAEVDEVAGPPSLLVNNAAGNFLVQAENLSVNGWRTVMSSVLDGTFYCTREAGLRMIEHGGGSILNVIATYAWWGNPGTVHSAAAKGGVLAMTRTLAVEWAAYGIRVNAIAPGPTETEGAGSRLWGTPGARESVERTIPRGRLARPDEIADAASYLLSPYADYISGECLVIDGGHWLGKGMFKYRDDPAE